MESNPEVPASNRDEALFWQGPASAGPVKKAERQRIDALELWCWRRLSRVPWTARRCNQSILKEISPEIPLEGMMLKLKSNTLATSCEELTHWKRLWCWEGLGAGGEGDDRGWDRWMASSTRWMWIWVNSGKWWYTGRPGVLRFMGSQRLRHDWATDLIWPNQTSITTLLGLIFSSFLHPYISCHHHISLGRNSNYLFWIMQNNCSLGTVLEVVKSLLMCFLF